MIRGIVKALLGISMFGGIPILFAAFQLQQIQNLASVEAQPITLANLIAKGAGDNAHVEVTEFVFGKPLMEQNGENSRLAWLPMYPQIPGARMPAQPPVVLRIRTPEAALPELLNARVVTAMVCRGMPAGSPWDLRLPSRFAEEYPKLEPAKTLLLSEPDVRFGSWSWEAGTVFNHATRNIAWAIGAGLTILGIGGLLWMSRADALAQRAAAPAEFALTPSTEPAISSYAFNTWEFASRGFKIMLFCGSLIAFCGLIFVLGVYLLRRTPDAGWTVMGVSSLLILINVFLIRSHFQYRTHGVASMDVCSSGLRWVKSPEEAPRSASWSEIVEFEQNHLSPYPWRHTLTITLRSGEVLSLAAFSLTHYHAFAKQAHDGYQQRANALAGASRLGGFLPLSTASKITR